tara:strand:+ start:115 stop:1095 length:981 start_codon:yes stop_codon:yes gene_type:complete
MKAHPNILVITPIKQINGLTQRLKLLGKVIYMPDPNINELLNLQKDIHIIFTNPNKSKIYLDKKIFSHFKNLNIICTASTGTVHINLNDTKKFRIKVISLTKQYKTLRSISSTAELAFTLMLGSLRYLITSTKSVQNNEWNYEKFIGRQINMLTIGIFGYGRLGKMFAKYCKVFGAKVIVYDPYKKVQDKQIKQLKSLELLAKDSDVISIHAHVTQETREIFNKSIFGLLKKNCILVNTSRGELVNEKDLLKHLNKHKRFKYATDVISNETRNKRNNVLLNYYKKNKNTNQLIITPHIGGMTVDAQYLAYNKAVDLLAASVKKIQY